MEEAQKVLSSTKMTSGFYARLRETRKDDEALAACIDRVVKRALPEYAKRLNIDLDQRGATIVEVGGKRNLVEFANIALSFNIPTGILYDEDSSDIQDQKEEAFNEGLDGLAKLDGTCRVWRLSKDYESNIRKT